MPFPCLLVISRLDIRNRQSYFHVWLSCSLSVPSFLPHKEFVRASTRPRQRLSSRLVSFSLRIFRRLSTILSPLRQLSASIPRPNHSIRKARSQSNMNWPLSKQYNAATGDEARRLESSCESRRTHLPQNPTDKSVKMPSSTVASVFIVGIENMLLKKWWMAS